MKVIRVLPLVAFACAAATLLWVGGLPSVSAHPSMRNYIQHRAVIDAGPTNIDVTMELTFYENSSMVERFRMDTNHNGRISKAEIQAYLNVKIKTLEESLNLTLDDKPLELVPLYDPNLDLMGDPRVRPHTHILRLYYFVRTPQFLSPGSVLALKDGLWAGTGAIRSTEVNGTGGFRFSSVPDREAGVWRARFQSVPATSESAALPSSQDQH